MQPTLARHTNIAKCCKKVGALGNLDQEFGDPDAREQRIEPAVQGLGFRRSCRLQRRDLQLFAHECDTRQVAGPQLVRKVAQSSIKFGTLVSQIEGSAWKVR